MDMPPPSEEMLLELINMGLMDVKVSDPDDPQLAINARGLSVAMATLGYLWALLEEHMTNEDDVDTAFESLRYQQSLKDAIEVVLVLWKALAEPDSE